VLSAGPAVDSMTPPINQSTLLGQFGLSPWGFLPWGFMGGFGMSQNLAAAVQSVDPTSSGALGMAGQLSARGQLIADLTTFGAPAAMSGQGPSDPTAGIGSQPAPVAGAGSLLAQPDNSTSPNFANLSQGRHGPGV
jgi:hypothetical protein